ncbi:MAG: WecB/TagA/CpsF family glycosyltransferase [Prevotella sp.]|nr:WecB/TagA/CpsF family glycosyltransferase [Prevotella sp.]
MTYRLKEKVLISSRKALSDIPEGKLLINTINQHSYNVAQTDAEFAAALRSGDYLLPDGMSIVKVAQWLKVPMPPTERIAGRDLFFFEMQRLNDKGKSLKEQGCPLPKVFFMGSSEHVLAQIKARATVDYPYLEVITYSPPYKKEFSAADNAAIIEAINTAAPDLLWIGMTAPKQEKWAAQHWNALNIHCHCGTIGAVFNFFANPKADTPLWWQQHGLEWLYRLKSEPRRLFRRYVIGIPKFFFFIIKEKIALNGIK